MYEDESLQNVKAGASTVFKLGKGAFDLYRRLAGNSNNIKNFESTKNVLNSFVFTGKSTDLSFFKDGNTISKGMLDEITDYKTKNNVIDTLLRADKEGLINVDLDMGNITLTEKGKEYINRPEFIKEAYKDQQAALSNPNLEQKVFGVELGGTDADLNFFHYGKELDLSSIAKNADTETAKKIFAVAEKWEKNGLVKVTPQNTLQLTKKGSQLLNSSAFKLANGKLAEKALTAVPVAGKVFTATKTLFNIVKAVTQAPMQSKGMTL